MTAHEVDVVVLGMGPGGEDAAGRLAEAGLSVAGVEARLVGGECPYWGCVPSKMMIRAADLLAEGRRIPGWPARSEIYPDWAPVARRIRDEATDNWDDKVAVDRFTGKGGTLFRGHGTITGPGEVTVGGDVLRARRAIVINTGTAPVRAAHRRVWRAPRTGPTGRPSRPPRCPGRWSSSAAGRSARSWPRFSPDSAPGSP